MAAHEKESSPEIRLKFLCSYGGKILPRPSDGQLRYVGGENRVLVVPRSISFSDLMDRIEAMFGDQVAVAKYQVSPEELETLVSVRSGEDLRHMIDEYDRRSPAADGSPRFRLFLFSYSSAAAASPTSTIDSSGGDRRGMHRVWSTPNLYPHSPAYGAHGVRYDTCACWCACHQPHFSSVRRGHYMGSTEGQVEESCATFAVDGGGSRGREPKMGVK